MSNRLANTAAAGGVPEKTSGTLDIPGQPSSSCEKRAISYPGPFGCNACSFTSTTWLSMELHFKCVHNIREFVFLCSKCEKSWPSINPVASHYPRCIGSVKAVVDPSSLANTCTTCGSSFGLDPACKNINQVLAERLMGYDITRSIEMIKGQRRKEQYKALVLQLRPVMSCDLIKEAIGMAIVDINELQNNIRKVFSSGRNPPTKSRGVPEFNVKKMVNPCVARFKRFQRLFRSNRRKLASHIFDKASLEQFGGSIDEASEHLEKFLSRPRLESDAYSAIGGDKSIGIAHPILAEEVEVELKSSRPTAVGPDGISLEDIKKLNSYDIASLFNIWLKAGDLSDSVKVSRTIFLPKNDGTTDILNCRPITIAYALYRLFSKILTRRLAAKLELNVRQKAFRPKMNGVFENCHFIRPDKGCKGQVERNLHSNARHRKGFRLGAPLTDLTSPQEK
ncbi:Retrovirus-related Pol polyprotein from type-1 retrotransposable element [Trichinella nelsoni]|uniref:Retrovirus-related Pol polyprotein from type-1 retrotransposable element n=1 Tax=Trichinella nelsoni TaxID=6336 RepID=A0A0V0RUW9_9BILA|nr:Retrovirus-related Pol polyprotein from type-1 retrotransposable element [Trichinella nelsoni]